MSTVSTDLSLEERLDRLEAIEAARETLARYADACDAQDVDGVVNLFAPDGLLDVPGQSYRGTDEIRAFYRQAWDTDPSQKSHFITNVKTRWLGAGRVAVDCYFCIRRRATPPRCSAGASTTTS
jgi:ketosteroid isomerase-like protein